MRRYAKERDPEGRDEMNKKATGGAEKEKEKIISFRYSINRGWDLFCLLLLALALVLVLGAEPVELVISHFRGRAYVSENWKGETRVLTRTRNEDKVEEREKERVGGENNW